jgi:uncharacterized membrane protein YgdD (TMEM256/DUF423 family)
MWSIAGALLLGLAVLIGAFGAHALRARLDAYAMGVYERAVFYHFVHALGLLVLGVAVRSGALSASAAALPGWLLLAGIAIFCGSLYALALSGVRKLGAITPLGGLAFIAGWVALAVAFATASAPPASSGLVSCSLQAATAMQASTESAHRPA